MQVHPAPSGPTGLHAAVGLLPRQAGRLSVWPGQTGRRVGQSPNVRMEPGVDPGLIPLQGTKDVSRAGREPLAQPQPGLLGPAAQVVDLGPGTFGIDVVRGER